MKATIKSRKAQIEKIKKSNNRYQKLDKAGKRVMIAKDVLSLIKSKNITSIKSNGYMALSKTLFPDIDFSFKRGRMFNEKFGDQKIIDLLPKVPECQVCGIGALFYADVCRNNGLLSGTANDSGNEDIHKRFKGIFTKHQLNLVESAFEKIHEGGYTEVFNRAINFGIKYRDDNDRLIAIMKNIIKNNGTFKP